MRIKRSVKMLTLISIILAFQACTSGSSTRIEGELKKWHRITLFFEGPETSELAENNPFLNYRLDVTFSHGNRQLVIPGFYAADGQAAESSADGGNQWAVRFSPDKAGEWTYKASFRQGENIAVADSRAVSDTQSAGYFDGASGSLNIAPSDKPYPDNRASGRLDYVGGPYLQYQESGKYFIKVGVDAPENLFAYQDFDATPNALGLRKQWEPHNGDFETAAVPYLWQGEKGKNLLGAINYLHSEELNVFSFLTFNIDGDDRNVFPYLLKVPESDYESYASDKKNKNAWDSLFHKTRLDVSKMEQWERILDYAETKGMFLHFKTHETETDHLMDGGVFGLEGKLYYRELIARFGHHLSMNWNLGEENNQPIEEVIKAANYVYSLDPYKHHLVIHTFPNQDHRYASFIGDQSPMTGASLQLSHEEFIDVHPRVLKWRHKSDSTGKRWALAVDEPGKAQIALLPDDEDMEHNEARGNALWGTLMAGGFGVEWYFGYASPNSDLTCQDFRSRDLFWDQNRHALRFFENHIPFWEMEPADHLTTDTLSFCLAQPGAIYAIYLPAALETTSLTLDSDATEYSVKWYDPRNGGPLQVGSVESVASSDKAEIGYPPNERKMDWVILIEKTDG